MIPSNLKDVLKIFNSHLLSRFIGAALVVALLFKSVDLLAEYSVLFSATQLIGLIFKFGFSQKVYRDTVEDYRVGETTLRKYNSIIYFLSFLVLLYLIKFEVNYIFISSILIAYSSVRCAYLLGCGFIKTSIFLEFTLPIMSIMFLLIIDVNDDIAFVILLGYLPSFLYILFLSSGDNKFGIILNTKNDYKSSFYFLFSGLTQQVNSHFAILILGQSVNNEIVSAVRVAQVMATPLQLINVSFATNFQKVAQGDPFHENRKYEWQYISIALLSTLVMNIAAILSLPYVLDTSKPIALITVFFGCFSAIYVLRVLLKFSDTRLIIKKQESIIFLFNAVISLVCITGGYIFAVSALPIPSYVMFNLGPLLLCLFSLIAIRSHRSNV